MSTNNSTLYGLQVGSAGSSPASSYPSATLVAGKLRYAVVELTAAEVDVASDILRAAKLVKGDRVIPGLSKVLCQNPGTTLTLDIGDAEDTDRYVDGLALGGAAKDVFWSSAPGVDAYNSFEVDPDDAEDVLLVTTAASGTVTTTAKIQILIAFLRD